jgi:cob(I)alamin adenosyltransferase
VENIGREEMKKNAAKGLVIVFTGDGKGKTTAALGTALRMVGHRKKVAMVQFFKCRTQHAVCLPGLKVWSFGGGFTWKVSRELNQKAIDRAWEKCRQLLRAPKYSLLIFDEINIALKHKFLKTPEIIKALKKKIAAQHVILTGRGAPRELIKAADLVTEMKCVKHPLHKGIPAQPGIEF